MNVRQILLIASVFFLCATACDQAKALPESSGLADARAVDQAVLMSESFVFGVRKNIGQRLRNRSDRDRKNIDACIHIRMDSVASQFFANMISAAIPKDDLRRGAALARDPVFVKLNAYIRANKELLREQVPASEPRVDHFFLLAAAQGLNITKDELRSVKGFISWHQSVAPALNSTFKLKLQELLATMNDSVLECVNTANREAKVPE